MRFAWRSCLRAHTTAGATRGPPARDACPGWRGWVNRLSHLRRPDGPWSCWRWRGAFDPWGVGLAWVDVWLAVPSAVPAATMPGARRLAAESPSSSGEGVPLRARKVTPSLRFGPESWLGPEDSDEPGYLAGADPHAVPAAPPTDRTDSHCLRPRHGPPPDPSAWCPDTTASCPNFGLASMSPTTPRLPLPAERALRQGSPPATDLGPGPGPRPLRLDDRPEPRLHMRSRPGVAGFPMVTDVRFVSGCLALRFGVLALMSDVGLGAGRLHVDAGAGMKLHSMSGSCPLHTSHG